MSPTTSTTAALWAPSLLSTGVWGANGAGCLGTNPHKVPDFVATSRVTP